MKITTITAKGNKSIPASKITVLVGPNNTGKSQFLRDVMSIMTSTDTNPEGVLIEEIEFEKIAAFDELMKGVKTEPHQVNPDDLICSGIKPNLAEADQFVINKKHLEQLLSEDIKKTLQLMGRLKVAYLDAGSRLIVATKKNSNEPEHSPENLLQALYKNRDKSVESDLENVFKTTFNMKIRFDYSAQIYLIFRVSKQFEHIPEDQRWAYPILKKYPILDTQGDGFRSFVGVVLSILLSENRIILLDEPEAFLHPTQARALGMWIGEQSVQQSGQIFIATHNGHFLSGLLSSGNEVSIYRFNRHDDFTKIHALPPEALISLSKYPLLSSQPIVDSVFYKGVVVCEADSDRCLYQTVTVKEFSNQEILFVHSHNKYSIKKVIPLIKNAGVPVACIVDLDILNSKDEFESLVNSFVSSPPSEILQMQKKLSASVYGISEELILRGIQAQISEFYEQLLDSRHDLAGAKGALERIQRGISKWSIVKLKGIEGFPESVQPDAHNLINILKPYGIFLVPVGELESWIHSQIAHKGRWIVNALDSIDKGECPGNLKEFVKEVIDYPYQTV